MYRTTKTCALGTKFGTMLAIAAASLMTVSGAKASPTSLIATLDATVDSFFTLDFGDAGGERGAFLSSTNFELKIDPRAGTAEFARYHQNIEPILLPFGPDGLSTGDITVEIVPGSSSGHYDAETGEFLTSDLYAITFSADLSVFGLFSPILLPSTSSGVVTYDTNWTGIIEMNWFGGGALAGLMPFQYTCTVNTTFTPPKVRDRETEVQPVQDGDGVIDADGRTEAEPVDTELQDAEVSTFHRRG